jgi:hypothetical protein
MFSIRIIEVISPGCQATLSDRFISGLFNDLGDWRPLLREAV